MDTENQNFSLILQKELRIKETEQYKLYQRELLFWVAGIYMKILGFTGGSEAKASASNAGDLGSIPGLGRYPGEGKATLSSILAQRIPWTM